jgi:hypothetical protein
VCRIIAYWEKGQIIKSPGLSDRGEVLGDAPMSAESVKQIINRVDTETLNLRREELKRANDPNVTSA